MASKQIYWKCADCNSLINDENMHEFEYSTHSHAGEDSVLFAEFCYGCMNYNPEVVIAYA